MGIRHTKEMTYKIYNKASKEAHKLAHHFGADPKAVQKGLDNLKQNQPTPSQRSNLN